MSKRVKKYKFNKKADAFLTKFYKGGNAATPHQQYDMLEGVLDGKHCFSHHPTIKQKVFMMEYELLHRCNLITLTLV
jgi:hypothetical protein